MTEWVNPIHKRQFDLTMRSGLNQDELYQQVDNTCVSNYGLKYEKPRPGDDPDSPKQKDKTSSGLVTQDSNRGGLANSASKDSSPAIV